MNVTFRCPHCDQTAVVDFDQQAQQLECPACRAAWPIAAGTVTQSKLARCMICPSAELYARKDFSQSVGVAIVVAGAVISSVFWAWRMPFWTYGVLFATALIDIVLYLTVGNVLQCYRCQAQYRGVPGLEEHGGFDLETHEKHRQQRIRLGQQVKAGS